MAAIFTITNAYQHIVITSSTGPVRNIPKTNLVIFRAIKNIVGGTEERIHLNWPSGDNPGAKDSLSITYDEVTSPTVASNTVLELLLKSWCANPTYLVSDTDLHVVDHYAIVGNEDAVLALVYEDGVARTDLAGKTLRQGVPMFPGFSDGGTFTHIKLTSGSVFICPSGAGTAPWTTSTTSTTTT